MTRMRLPRSVRIFVLLLCTVLVSALGYGVHLLSRLAPIGTAYAAKTLCSGVFVSHRGEQGVIREDIRADNHPLLRVIHASVDLSSKTASATFLGLARRDAVFRSGRGCALAFGEEMHADQLSDSDPPAAAGEYFAPDTDRRVDASQLRSAVDWAFSEPDPNRLRRTRAVVVLHHGRLLAERYANGFSAHMPMLGWSMTKSVTGALIGILVREGKLALDDRGLLSQWTTEGDPRAQITLDQLLRMTSGLRFTENHSDPLEDVAIMLFARRDAAAYAIGKPLEVPPGTRWSYSSGTSNILAAVMRRAIGGSEQDYLLFPRLALFNPLGMHDAVLESDASGTFVASSYLYASPHDWARFGQFLLQDGTWNGRKLLPQGWVTYMSPPTPQCPRGVFGAHLWVKETPPFNTLLHPPPQLPADTFHAIGHE